MEVNLEDAGTCRKVMHVRASADAVASEYNAVVRAYAKTVKVPGFRPGKAPVEVVERRYAKGIVEQAKDRLVPRFYREALSQEGIVPVAIVGVSDVALGKEQGLAFKVTIDVTPEFKLLKYRKIVLKRNKVEIGEKDVNEAFDRLLESFSQFEDVTGRNVKEGDLVMLDYSGQCEGESVGKIAPDCLGLGEGKDFSVLVGKPEFLPGFSAGLVGSAIGEKRKIEVHFPDDYHVPAIAGKDAVYTVVIKSIREKILPELDGEFLKRLKVESKEELRQKVRSDLLDAAEKREKERLKDEIAKFLLANTDFDLPLSIVEQETNLTVRNILERIAMQGATKKQIEERQEEIVNAATRSSKDRVKLSYILIRIADEEKIVVQENEVESRIESMVQHYNVLPDRFRAELEKRNGVEKLKSDIRAEKTLDFLLEKAKIKK